MPTIIETAIHLLLVAYPAQSFFLIRNLELHNPLAMPLTLAEAAGVNIACLGIDHLALTVRVVVGPGAGVCIAVCESHVALPGFQARDKGTSVGIADGGD